MPKAVRFDEYGGIDVLRVVDVERPVPRADEVLVQVKAAGINPGEASIRKGVFAKVWPATFPSGQGTDFAGVIAELGPSATGFRVGDEVVGYTEKRASHAELVLAHAGNLVRKPPNVSWDVAGALFVAGTTAYAAVRAVSLRAGDTVVVSGAAGGVGSLAIQLARIAGAKVVGLASENRRDWLAAHGVTAVSYGPGTADRIRTATDGKVDAFIDTFGADYIELALSLAVKPDRINTIIDFAGAKKYGVKSEGNAVASSAGVLAELVGLVAEGRLEVPIAKTYPLADVQAAYRDLEERHTLGKIVLRP
jgi:NADPH:quinone reductase-like Zn-dependent oxidoreductase